MKIIDYEKKGNVVRFYLGKDDLEDWYGDDWNDRPYEHNAGRVYDEYISGYMDVSFPFDDVVLEPCNGCLNSEYSKDDMKARNVPCLIVVPKSVASAYWSCEFDRFVGSANVIRYYFGDSVDPKDIKEFNPEDA